MSTTTSQKLLNGKHVKEADNQLILPDKCAGFDDLQDEKQEYSNGLVIGICATDVYRRHSDLSDVSCKDKDKILRLILTEARSLFFSRSYYASYDDVSKQIFFFISFFVLVSSFSCTK